MAEADAGEAEQFPYLEYIEQVWNAQNPAALARYFSTDVVVRSSITDAAMGSGIGVVLQYARTLFAAFPDIHFTVADLVAQGDKLAVRLIWEGTHLGSFAGLAASGNRVQIAEFAIYRVQDGKLAEVWSLADLAELKNQLGAPI